VEGVAGEARQHDGGETAGGRGTSGPARRRDREGTTRWHDAVAGAVTAQRDREF
jgi:hypothetical protein